MLRSSFSISHHDSTSCSTMSESWLFLQDGRKMDETLSSDPTFWHTPFANQTSRASPLELPHSCQTRTCVLLLSVKLPTPMPQKEKSSSLTFELPRKKTTRSSDTAGRSYMRLQVDIRQFRCCFALGDHENWPTNNAAGYPSSGASVCSNNQANRGC